MLDTLYDYLSLLNSSYLKLIDKSLSIEGLTISQWEKVKQLLYEAREEYENCEKTKKKSKK